MPPLVLSPADALRFPDAIGGKAAGLLRLGRWGLAVPPWFVIPTGAMGQAEPEALAAAVRAGLAALPGGEDAPVAVRSSAVGEDGTGASFAGQLESFLFVRGAEAVAAAARRCIASGAAARVRAYRGAGAEPLRVAVVVQQMVDGDVSGVLFTAHPASGSRRHALAAAARGLCEGVVSGRVDADEWTAPLDGDGPLVSALREQAEAARYDAETGAVVYRPLTGADRTAPALLDAEVRELVRLGAEAARRAGQPLDLEWTRADGRFWLLQARPVTALPSPQPGTGTATVWDNANIQESYSGVTTPLTFSFARRAYATVYRQTMRAVGLPERVVAAHEPLVNTLLGLHRGRVYYNLQSWYRGLLLLPAFRRNKADMERMMGLDAPVDFVQDERPSAAERFRRLPGLARTAGQLLARFARIDRHVAGFHADFRAAYGRVDRATLHERSAAELVDLAGWMREAMLERWTAPIVNDFYVMMMGGRVRRALEQAGIEQPDLTVSGLLAGLDVESLAPTRHLLALAHHVHADAALAALVDALPDARLPAVLEAEHPTFWSACHTYLDAYGDRAPGELKLETVTPREDPARLFGLLRGLLTRPDLDPERLRADGAALRERTEREVRARIREAAGLATSFRLRRFRADLQRFRQGVRHRESTRMERTRLFGLFRSVYLALGRALHLQGALDAPRDVLYLTVDELDALRDGTTVQADLRPLVAARRAEFDGYRAEKTPHRFQTWDLAALSPLDAPAPPASVADGARRLSGTGCFPGVVEGEAVVVTDPDGAPDVAGRILVAVRTDPGWTPLFPQARGLVVERGSALSHSAIVARELGVPCAVGLPGLTARVRTGDRVRLDGGAGTLDLLTDPPPPSPATP